MALPWKITINVFLILIIQNHCGPPTMAAENDYDLEESDAEVDSQTNDAVVETNLVNVETVGATDETEDANDKTSDANDVPTADAQVPPSQPEQAIEGNRAPHFPWPFGVIPFTINEKSFDNEVTFKIMAAIEEIQRSTCLQFSFLEKVPSLPFLNFTNDKGQQDCDHNVYTPEGTVLSVPVILGYNCLKRSEIIHSILHGLGFNDEHQHPRRDYFINVLWDNILPSKRHLFRLMPFAIIFMDVGYDYYSVMHLPSRKYTRNGKQTMTAIEPGQTIMPGESLSDGDQRKIDLYFGPECRRRDFTSMLKMCKNIFSSPNSGNNL